MFQEQPTGNWVYGFLMLLLNILDIRPKWDLIRWLDQPNSWDQKLVPHLFDGLCHFPLDSGLQPCLVPIIQLSGIIQEFDHHRQVFVIYIFLLSSSHDLFSELFPIQWPVYEHSWLLLIEFKKLFSPLNHIMIGEISIFCQKWRVISILLLILPIWLIIIIPVSLSVIPSTHRNRGIWSNILPQSQLNDPISRELLSRLKQHLPSGL